MALAPKPITVTQVATLPAGLTAPQPFVIVGALPAAAVPLATAGAAGTVKKAATIAAAVTFADLPAVVVAYNDLLAKLKAAGIMA